MRALGVTFIVRTSKPKMAGGHVSPSPIQGLRDVLGEDLWPVDMGHGGTDGGAGGQPDPQPGTMRGFVRTVLRAASSDCAHARARTPRSSNRRTGMPLVPPMADGPYDPVDGRLRHHNKPLRHHRRRRQSGQWCSHPSPNLDRKTPESCLMRLAPLGADGPYDPVDGRPAPGRKGYGRDASWRRGNGDKGGFFAAPPRLCLRDGLHDA
jgi:hypothetical protein